MSFLATIRTSPIAGQNVTYTFSNSIDTTTIQPGQAFDIRAYLLANNIIKNPNVTTRVNIVIPVGVTISSSDPSKPVLTISNFKSRDTITIINRGNIHGAGGYGGAGGYQTVGSPGTAGGNAVVLSSGKCLIDNLGGVIGSGSGGNGGSGGTATYISQTCSTPYECGGCTRSAGFKCYNFISCTNQYNGNCNGNTVRGGTSGGTGPWFDFYYYVFKTCHSYYDCSYWSYGTGAAGANGAAGGGAAGATGAANYYGAGAGGAAGISIKGTNYLLNVPGGIIRGNTTPT